MTNFIDWLWKAQSRFMPPFKCEIGLFWKACHWLRYWLAVKAVNSRPHKDSHWRSVFLCLAFFLLELWLFTSGSSGLEHNHSFMLLQCLLWSLNSTVYISLLSWHSLLIFQFNQMLANKVASPSPYKAKLLVCLTVIHLKTVNCFVCFGNPFKRSFIRYFPRFKFFKNYFWFS